MAALRDLRVTVAKASPTEDHSTFKYHIQLQHGSSKWEVQKRFSEFDVLLQSLACSRCAGLPKMPAKTLLGSPTDAKAIDGRKEQLRIILYDLLMRADTRTCQPLRQFLAIDSHVDAPIRCLQADAMRTFEDPRFGVSGLDLSTRAGLVLVTHEDSTHLSKLGRVWSVVEPDELGALHVWSHTTDGTWKRAFSKTYGVKARCLAWEDSSRQLFVGLEDGRIEVFSIPSDGPVAPSLVTELRLHHNSPVTHLSVSPRRLLSLGFDTAMRVVDVTTKELKCGGRLTKRLKCESDYLTSGFLDDERDRAFIGTSGGEVFVLDIAQNPPGFAKTLDMGSKPVSSMCGTREHLYVAHCDCVSVFSLEAKGQETKMTKLGSHRAKYLCTGEATILSVAAAPERHLVFGGYSDGSLAVWTTRQSEAFMVTQAHDCDLTMLSWVQDGTAPWGPALLSGGGDGKVTTWALGGTEDDYALWSPHGIASDGFGSSGAPSSDIFTTPIDGTSSAVASVFEPNFGNAGDMFRIDNPRVNPQALKRDDESDSDDEPISDAFR